MITILAGYLLKDIPFILFDFVVNPIDVISWLVR